MTFVQVLSHLSHFLYQLGVDRIRETSKCHNKSCQKTTKFSERQPNLNCYIYDQGSRF